MNSSNLAILLRPALLAALLFGTIASAAQPTVTTPRIDEKKVIAYKITRGDRIAVSVFGEPELTAGNKRVDGRGCVNLTLIGDVRIYGMTLSEASNAIEEAYINGRILRKPEVTVTVEEYSPRSVTVSGKVKYPGKVELPPEQQWTIRDVILKVGGFEDTAKGTAVRLIRPTPDGSNKVYTLDVQSALLGKDKAASSPDASFIVEPDDTVYVPEKLI